jgi:predicted DNA-binding WGR domain protein
MSGDAAFPITVVKQTLEHRTHEKDYHQVLIRRPDGRSLLVQRWGRRGSFGQMQVLALPDALSSDLAYREKLREKESRGYEPQPVRLFTVATENELKKMLATVWLKLGADNIKHLLPDASTDAVRDPPPVAEWGTDKDGKPVLLNPVKPKAVKETEPTIADRVAVDPEWGAW